MAVRVQDNLDRLIAEEFDEIEPVGRRYGRPLAGIAIAATVAVVAIFGLQQMTTPPGAGVDSATPAVAESAAEDSWSSSAGGSISSRPSGNASSSPSSTLTRRKAKLLLPTSEENSLCL